MIVWCLVAVHARLLECPLKVGLTHSPLQTLKEHSSARHANLSFVIILSIGRAKAEDR